MYTRRSTHGRRDQGPWPAYGIIGEPAVMNRNARQRALMLGLATVGFAVNFWAWALLSPLAPKFKDALHLTAFQQALLVAVPVVVGSLGRIPVGALTDRFEIGRASCRERV